jgi:hypothetical protein
MPAAVLEENAQPGGQIGQHTAANNDFGIKEVLRYRCHGCGLREAVCISPGGERAVRVPSLRSRPPRRPRPRGAHGARRRHRHRQRRERSIDSVGDRIGDAEQPLGGFPVLKIVDEPGESVEQSLRVTQLSPRISLGRLFGVTHRWGSHADSRYNDQIRDSAKSLQEFPSRRKSPRGVGEIHREGQGPPR